MKNILVVYYGNHNPTHVLDFVLNSAKQNEFKVQGIFVDEDPSPSLHYPFPNDLNLTEEKVTTDTVEEENEKILSENIQFFQDECSLANVNFSFEKNVPIKSLVENSFDADLIVMDSTSHFQDTDLTNILKSNACPVCQIVPTASKPERIVFAFDGSENCMFAIQKFVDLFPGFYSLESSLVTMKKETEILIHKEFINDWLFRHFPKLDIEYIEGKSDDDFIDYLRKYPDNTLLVMGAYGRSSISTFFHPSHAHKVIADTRLSLFSAHK